MSKSRQLSQYRYLKQEQKDLLSRIERTKKQIEQIENEGTVLDTVKGGEGGIQHFKIEGVRSADYSQKKTRLYLHLTQYENDEAEISEMTENVLKYISSIDDSRDRMICRFYYIDCLSQQKIAGRMHLDQSAVSRILDKYKY